MAEIDLTESIATLERQATDPMLPRWVRMRCLRQAARRRMLVEQHPQRFTLSADTDTTTDTRGEKERKSEQKP